MFCDEQTKLKEELAEVRTVSISTDMWTSKSNVAFTGINLNCNLTFDPGLPKKKEQEVPSQK